MQSDIEEFEQFWKAYPRRVGKGDARKAWKQTASIRPPLTDLISAIERAKKTDQWQKDGGQYICHCSTWLRGERWADEHEVSIPQGADTTQAWQEFRESIRSSRKPNNAAVLSAVSKFGGLHRLGGMSSFEIERLRAEFDTTYRAASNH